MEKIIEKSFVCLFRKSNDEKLVKYFGDKIFTKDEKLALMQSILDSGKANLLRYAVIGQPENKLSLYNFNNNKLNSFKLKSLEGVVKDLDNVANIKENYDYRFDLFSKKIINIFKTTNFDTFTSSLIRVDELNHTLFFHVEGSIYTTDISDLIYDNVLPIFADLKFTTKHLKKDIVDNIIIMNNEDESDMKDLYITMPSLVKYQL